jgi:hypothetical protein
MDPTKRRLTAVLAAGVVVLLAAILIGEHMGDSVIVEAVDAGKLSQTLLVTPVPQSSSAPYGPDWKRSQMLAAAPDPNFPDPRIPPKPLPTLQPSPTPAVTPTWTPNPHIPIWDQTPPPSPSASPATEGGAAADPSPADPEPSVSP